MYSSQARVGHGRGAAQKVTPSTRRVWTIREEKVLLAALKDLVSNGWKSDNGFRTGYLTKLEDAMRKEFPKTDLTAIPNITSKITAWKKYYGSILTAHSVTGVGFTVSTSQLDCDDDQWAEVVNRNPKMRGMRYKEWPYYPDWVEIFGKDRATGDTAEDVSDAANRSRRTEPVVSLETEQEHEANGDNYVNLDVDTNVNYEEAPFNDDQFEANSTAYTTRTAPAPRHTGKKRKINVVSADPEMVKLLSEFCRSTAERLETIAQRIGYDHDLGKARQQLYTQLGNIPGLSIRDRLNVAREIGGKIENLEIFMGLPDEARAIYVMDIMERDLQ